MMASAVLTVEAGMDIETTPVIIQVWDDEEYDADLNIVVDSLEVCQIRLEKDQDKGLHDVCSFDLPKDASELTLQGTFSRVYETNIFGHNWGRRKRVHGRQQFKIVDTAPMTHHLRDTSRPFGKRIRDFQKATVDFAQQFSIIDEELLFLELGKAVPASMIKAAEKHLGFNLPAEHVNLLLETGQFYIDYIDYSYLELAGKLDNAYNHIISPQGLGYPKDAIDILPSNVITLLKSSVILYIEVGDGLGFLLYQLKGPADCNSKEAYYWIHDHYMVDPLLLKNRDGSCKTYTEAMIWLLAQQFLYINYENYYSYPDTSIVLVDSSAPRGSKLRLWFPWYKEAKFMFNLPFVWEEFE